MSGLSHTKDGKPDVTPTVVKPGGGDEGGGGAWRDDGSGCWYPRAASSSPLLKSAHRSRRPTTFGLTRAGHVPLQRTADRSVTAILTTNCKRLRATGTIEATRTAVAICTPIANRVLHGKTHAKS